MSKVDLHIDKSTQKNHMYHKFNGTTNFIVENLLCTLSYGKWSSQKYSSTRNSSTKFFPNNTKFMIYNCTQDNGLGDFTTFKLLYLLI